MNHGTREVVAVLCSANLVRSPLAVAILRQRIEERGRQDIAVLSAGLRGIPGQPAVPEARMVARERHLDLSDHVSRAVDSIDWGNVSLVLTMTESQRARVLQQRLADITYAFTVLEMCRLLRSDTPARDSFGDLARRAHRARPVTLPPGAPEDIPDPSGKSLRHFHRTATQLEEAIDGLVRHLRGSSPARGELASAPSDERG